MGSWGPLQRQAIETEPVPTCSAAACTEIILDRSTQRQIRQLPCRTVNSLTIAVNVNSKYKQNDVLATPNSGWSVRVCALLSAVIVCLTALDRT